MEIEKTLSAASPAFLITLNQPHHAPEGVGPKVLGYSKNERQALAPDVPLRPSIHARAPVRKAKDASPAKDPPLKALSWRSFPKAPLEIPRVPVDDTAQGGDSNPALPFLRNTTFLGCRVMIENVNKLAEIIIP